MGAEMAPFTEWTESTGLPWHLLDHAPHRGVRDLLAEVNRLCSVWPAIYERDHEPTGFQWLEADDSDNSMFSFLRWGYAGGTAIACIANFTPVPRPGYRVGLPWSGEWDLLLDTDSPAWGGSGFGGYSLQGTRFTSTPEVAWQGQASSTVVDVPPLSVMWLGARRP
jgi:1,4-alpha-glucan branching enzyme